MKPHCFPQRVGRIVGFLSQLFFQATKLSQPLCLGEVGAREKEVMMAKLKGSGSRCPREIHETRNKQNEDACAIGLYKICNFNPLSSLSFHAA